MTTDMEATSTIRKRLMRIAEYVTRLTFWIFIVSVIYGIGFFLWELVYDPTMPLYMKLIFSSVAIFLLSLFFLFLLDEEDW